MSSLNKIMLIGNLGKDPEAKHINDKKMVTFSVATSKKFKGEEQTSWHNVVVWNEHTAEYVSKWAKKGTMVYVEGESITRKWEDKEGNTRYSTEVVVGGWGGNVNILSRGRDEGDQGKQHDPEPEGHAGGHLEADDDIPF